MGETLLHKAALLSRRPFSILKRIVMGETTSAKPVGMAMGALPPFSILKRIVMGET